MELTKTETRNKEIWDILNVVWYIFSLFNILNNEVVYFWQSATFQFAKLPFPANGLNTQNYRTKLHFGKLEWVFSTIPKKLSVWKTLQIP